MLEYDTLHKDVTWEMQIYANALTTQEVLRMATIGGARFTGIDADLGSLQAGKIGDLLVLNANPLADIKNTMNLEYVMKEGILYDAATLDEKWPRSVAFDPVPWKRMPDMAPRARPLDYWDR